MKKLFEPRYHYIRAIAILLSTFLSFFYQLINLDDVLQQKAHTAQKYLNDLVVFQKVLCRFVH